MTTCAPSRLAIRSSTGCETVDDPWLHVRRDAMLGELARIEHRFDDAVLHIGRAAETSGRLGFLQTEAYQLSSLGRAQCQAGDYASGAATLELGSRRPKPPATYAWRRSRGSISDASCVRPDTSHRHARHSKRRPPGTAPPGAANRPRSASACWRRSTPRTRCAGAEQRLVAILEEARREDDAPVEVLALDALARIAAEGGDVATARELCEAADRRMEAASHFITDLDRTRRPRGQADRLSCWCNTTNASSPPITMAMPAICR